jgi:tripartite-type tricarboxylate transporter receptor subunit TctC
MNSFLLRAVGSLVMALAATSAAVAADPFPSRPIKIIVNTAPGGLTDVMARLVAQKMVDNLKQTVFVENQGGGGGLIGIRTVKSAPADGYTLLGTAGTIALQMVAKQDPGYDLLKDFTGIGLMGRSPFLLVEAPSLPDKTFADLVTRAKANPGKLTYASAGPGTVPHIAAARFIKQLGLDMVHVPYKGNGAAMPDVMAGRVDVILEAFGSSSAKVESGQLKALGVTGTSRLSALPNVPTLAEQGVANYSHYTWLCFMAPAGTPKEVVQRLSQALRSATSTTSIRDRYRADGMEAMDMSPEEFNQFLGREVAQAQKFMNELGLQKQQ